MSSNQSILFFDGVCNLCNGAVDFFIRHDKNKVLKYAPLQGESAAKTLSGSLTNELSTVVLYHQGKTYIKSSAVLKTLTLIGGIYSFLGIFQIIPQGILDTIYDFVARNRYRFFGKKDSCRLPTSEERQLFLD